MPARYAPLPTQRPPEHSDDELDAAFNGSDDELDYDDDNAPVSESQPLNPSRAGRTSPPLSAQNRPLSIAVPGTYDFERVDYDVPPPGSPTRAIANDYGNTNGNVPSFDTDVGFAGLGRGSARTWFSRTAANVLPLHYVRRLGLGGTSVPAARVGGGVRNDGVFSNITAKPERRRQQQTEGDDSIYLAPEETQREGPPSYASAQADAVPPYWETTTIHLPSGVSASSVPGEMVIEGLPTGTLFSFLWNMLVSISFQFVGFLLTFLLHTTHAAKYGSRAGLGVTLIQYGFALRTRLENVSDGTGLSGTDGSSSEGYPGWRLTDPARPTFETAAEADRYYKTHPPPITRRDNYQMSNGTDMSMPSNGVYVNPFADSTSEWLSFFLMTVGWFILLTSVLSYWRVKRWERSILASSDTVNSTPSENLLSRRLRAAFGNHAMLRHGFSLSRDEGPNTPNSAAVSAETAARMSQIGNNVELGRPSSDSGVRLAHAWAEEARLQSDLRAAGLM
ncbi:hypothetical protein BDM02DRAFT_3232405 [Thelephora ganbajun]|uniref:Uncharacterized protein n=1 Tax=Thelephora ganbajun TaxID=370292 RepID=A0ACB6ZV31_THEGA|nr:hypothetical protein BDM02DRAFT_3232405 [Thelephora ganbajun]